MRIDRCSSYMLVDENNSDIFALGELLESLLDSRQWGFYGQKHHIAFEYIIFFCGFLGGAFATARAAGRNEWVCILLASTTKKFFF